jgi:hypothetical protein
VAAEGTNQADISFNDDGTKMYVLNIDLPGIYQYALTTPWDVSTASYDSNNFSVASQEAGPQGIYFKSDYSKVYMVGNGDVVYQYSVTLNQLTELQYVQSGDDLYITHPDTQIRKLKRFADDNWKLETIRFDLPPMEHMPERYTAALDIRVGTAADTATADKGEYVLLNIATGDQPDMIPQAGKIIVAGTGRVLVLGFNQTANGHGYTNFNLRGVGFVLESFDAVSYTSWYLLGDPYTEVTLYPDIAAMPVDSQVRILPTAAGGLARYPLSSFTGVAWVLSPVLGSNIYYLNVNITTEPASVFENNKAMDDVATPASIANEGEWGWGDADTLGFNTLYWRIFIGKPCQQYISESVYRVHSNPEVFPSH